MRRYLSKQKWFTENIWTENVYQDVTNNFPSSIISIYD